MEARCGRLSEEAIDHNPCCIVRSYYLAFSLCFDFRDRTHFPYVVQDICLLAVSTGTLPMATHSLLVSYATHAMAELGPRNISHVPLLSVPRE
jgi:hypothetical protein